MPTSEVHFLATAEWPGYFFKWSEWVLQYLFKRAKYTLMLLGTIFDDRVHIHNINMRLQTQTLSMAWYSKLLIYRSFFVRSRGSKYISPSVQILVPFHKHCFLFKFSFSGAGIKGCTVHITKVVATLHGNYFFGRA